VLERVEAAARVVDLEDPLRSIAPVEEILPLRVLEPEPASERLARVEDAPTVPRLMDPLPLDAVKA
jgi:hypothetical protein